MHWNHLLTSESTEKAGFYSYFLSHSLMHGLAVAFISLPKTIDVVVLRLFMFNFQRVTVHEVDEREIRQFSPSSHFLMQEFARVSIPH